VKKLVRIIRNLILLFFLSSIGMVLVYKWLPVYVTPLMVIRSAGNLAHGHSPLWHHKWVSYDHIAHNLTMAVIASEDNRFATHHGFDYKAIEEAVKENKTRKKPRGASTISQQTAKNVFLWPQSSWLRKGLEAYFTELIELIWGKQRIMEVYLNSIEMGKNIYGAEAVARRHFGTHASKLTANQCALIAATLPNPRVYNSAKPSRYMLKRQKQILRLMRLVPPFPKPANAKKR